MNQANNRTKNASGITRYKDYKLTFKTIVEEEIQSLEKSFAQRTPKYTKKK